MPTQACDADAPRIEVGSMDRKNMRDVAARAGVSQATVSRVVHSPHLVKPDTRQKVAAAMEEVGYVYNTVAADFTRQKNSMIGLIIFTVRSSIHSELIEGIQEELESTRFSLVIANSRYDEATERMLIQLFRERNLSGVIVAETTDENRPELKTLQESGVPLVLTWQMAADPDFDCVGIDNHRSAYEMTKYLIGLGHERIGLIAGNFDRIERVRQRLEGYRRALEEAGIAFDPAIITRREPSPMEGKMAMSQLLALQRRPTAVFAASDALALGALAACGEYGLRVPDDISVSGFDDVDFAPFCVPPLTTVRVPGYEMGKRAVRAILDQHEWNGHGPIRLCLPTELVIRGSCAAPNR
jgi:DNA-binding LacI/PurR family transcriptional regulator